MPHSKDVNLTEFLSIGHKAGRRICPVQEATSQLEQQELKQLHGALATDPRVITPTAIAIWLEKRGFPATQNIITAHRQGHCSCAR